MKNREWNSMEEQGSSLWRDAFLRLSRNRAAMFSLLALALIVAACFLGPLLPWLPHPNVQDLSRIAESPSWQYWFGTDQLGRDLLARVLFAPYEVPVVILMAFLGGPFFIYLILKNRRGSLE